MSREFSQSWAKQELLSKGKKRKEKKKERKKKEDGRRRRRLVAMKYSLMLSTIYSRL